MSSGPRIVAPGRLLTTVLPLVSPLLLNVSRMFGHSTSGNPMKHTVASQSRLQESSPYGICYWVGLAGLLMAPRTVIGGDCPAGSKENSARVISIGAVAYAGGCRVGVGSTARHFRKQWSSRRLCPLLPLRRPGHSPGQAQVDIAWNTPLAHARYELKVGNASQTCVMRDVDCNFHSMQVVRADAKIGSLDDLKGKMLILGCWQATEATALPIHFVKS